MGLGLFGLLAVGLLGWSWEPMIRALAPLPWSRSDSASLLLPGVLMAIPPGRTAWPPWFASPTPGWERD